MVKFKGMLDGTTKKFAAKKVNKNVAKLALLEVIGLLPASLLLLANKTHICQIIGWCQSPKVLGLQFKAGIGRADRDNAIDLYIGEEYMDVLADGV